MILTTKNQSEGIGNVEVLASDVSSADKTVDYLSIKVSPISSVFNTDTPTTHEESKSGSFESRYKLH